MFAKADQKLALNKVVMGELKDKTTKEVDMMLRQGIISVTLNENKTDEQIERFSKESIEEIFSKKSTNNKT